MRLPFFRSKDASAEPAKPQRARGAAAAGVPADEASVAAARTQARRRLVGAVLLLAVGVIGFPLLFETQPRPLPAATPIVVATEAGTRPASPMPTRPLPVLPADAGVEPVGNPASAATQPEAAAPKGAVASAAKPALAPVRSPAPVAAAASTPRPAAPLPPPATKPVSPNPPPATAATPAAAPAATPATGRWVVQVGAYNDAERLKAARAKLQKLGYASYTQEVDSSTGRRTRVRVGPFKTRAEAEAVAAKVKTAGLQTAVLSL